MKIYFIRHGKTQGNMLRRFIGSRTDQSLCQAGKEELTAIKEKGLYPAATKVYVSPMRRCRETAEILFPGSEQFPVYDMREMDFGIFENRSHDDMKDEAEYKTWLSSMCEGPVPQGEDKRSFTERCRTSFLKIMEQLYGREDSAVFVVHGGTIMAVLSELVQSDRAYHKWYTENGHGYLCSWDGKELKLENAF